MRMHEKSHFCITADIFRTHTGYMYILCPESCPSCFESRVKRLHGVPLTSLCLTWTGPSCQTWQKGIFFFGQCRCNILGPQISTEGLGKHSKKNYGIIWEFFPTWGEGSSQFPKPKTKKKVPLNHPKIT